MRKVAIRKAYISPQEYRQYLEDVNPLGGSIHSLRMQPAEYKTPAEARSLMSGENVFFRNNLRYARHKNIDKLPLELDGVPLGGRFTYPAELFSFNPDFQSHSKADVPSSYKHGNRPLHLYGFEGKNTPQRYAEVLQPEGIIYGDVPESDIQRITNRPIDFHALRMAATALMPTNNLSIDELKEKEIEAAKQLIAYGIPPVLSEDVSPVTLERTPQSWESIEDFHDPFQQWSKNQQLLNEPLTDFTFPKGEPMEIAFQLLKQSLELQPPMTQSVEEQAPMQEDTPMIDMQTIENNDPCSCAETVRTEILSDYQNYLNQIIEDEDEDGPNWTFGEENDPEYETPHKHEALKYMESLIEEVENASCEEIMEYELYDEMCDNAGFSEADQMKYTGEPMDIALRLLKNDYSQLLRYRLFSPRFRLNENIAPMENLPNYPLGLDKPDDMDVRFINNLKNTMRDTGRNHLNFRTTNESSPDFVPLTYWEKRADDKKRGEMLWQNRLDELQAANEERKRMGIANPVNVYTNRKPLTVRLPKKQEPENEEAENEDEKLASEPMNIAFQLLKEDIDYQDEEYIHPHEQIWNDEADEQLIATTNSLWDYVENMSDDDKLSFLNNQGNYFMNMAFQNHFPTTKEELDRAVMEIMFDAWQDSQAEMPGGIDFGDTKPDGLLDPVRAHAVHPSQWKKLASEPMEIAFQLLKERVSPEAKQHKLEYDKQYESSPERVKYRELLNQERRKRGIYGSHDHMDVSHTQGNRLTLENEHANRARHFKDKGTLREL